MAGMMDQFGFGAPAMPGGINAVEIPSQVKQALIQQLLAKRAQAGQAPVPGQIAIDPVALSGTAMTPSPMAVPKFGDGVQQPSTQGFTQNPPAIPSADAPAPGAVNSGPAVGGNVTPPPAAPLAGPMLGLGNDGQSYDSIQRKRKLAQEMMKSGTDASPVGHWTQALARVAGAGVGKYLDNKLDTSEKETNKAIIAALTGRSAQPATPGQNVTNQPGQPPQGTLSAYAQAVAKVESGGRYDATGPQTKSGDRAYGKYQVLGANIPQWTKEVLGQSMTPQQFLANPQAQDAVFNKKFGSYMAQFGNPNDAVSMWFSGKPLAAAGNRSDGYNTVPQYLKKVLAALPGGGQAAQAPQAAAGGIGGLSPQAMMAMAFDPRVSPQMRQGILAMAQMQAQQAQTQLINRPDGSAFSYNPRTGQTKMVMAPGAQKPTFGVIGKDQFGNEQYGFVDATNRQVSPVNGPTGAQQGVPAMPQGGVQPGAMPGQPAQSIPPPPPGVDPKVWRQKHTEKMVNGEKLTEGQSKDVGFYQRGTAANTLLEGKEGDLLVKRDAVFGAIPIAGNMLTSGKYQAAQQAGRDFLAVILRKDTGAAVTPQEFATYGDIFLPKPGDGPEAVAQKREARARALEGIRTGLGSVKNIVEASRPKESTAGGSPKIGVVEQGYRFKGGNPADPKSWEKVQ